MSIKEKYEYLVAKISYNFKPGNRLILFFDSEETLMLESFEITSNPILTKQLFKKKGVEKIVKKLLISEIHKFIGKFKATNDFLLHFFEIMEQQEERVGDKVIFQLSNIFQSLQIKDVQYFEFYRYLYEEVSVKGKSLAEALEPIKGFENYIEFFKILDTIKEEEKAKLFNKLKEKVLKEEEIKKAMISPLIQPLVMLSIIIILFVSFSQGLMKDIVLSFTYLGYADKIPGITLFIYNFGNFIKENYMLIIFFVSNLILFMIAISNFNGVKKFISKMLLNIEFYKYFNEMFMGYMILLQSTDEKKTFGEVIENLKKSYSSNIYYGFIYGLILEYYKKAADNIVPLRKYGYIFSNEFIIQMEQIIKQRKLVMINSYLRFVDNKINQLIGKFKTTLSLIGMIIVSVGILILFGGMFIGNNAKSSLLEMQSKGNIFEANVIPNSLKNILDNNKKDEY